MPITNDYADRVKQLVAAFLEVEERDVTLEKRFEEDLGADSPDQVELVVHLEDEFGIEFTDEEAATITSVQAAINAVNKKLP